MNQSLAELCNFFPRQREALTAALDHQFTLYGGAAGGGKSRFLRWVAVVLLMRWARRGFKGVRVGLFSMDYPTLHDRQLSKLRNEFPDWLGKFHDQTREFRLYSEYGGGVICFRNLDDVSKYKSSEFAAILVEELTEIVESVFRFLLSRLRWPGIEDPKFLGATNPGSVGHEWCKRLWIDRVYDEELQPLADRFAYVRALARDNPYNSAAYLEMLDALPDNLRAALRDGSWDVFSGQVFGEFRRDVHVVEPFEIPSWWQRWLANDPGYNDPGCWYWQAADQDGNVYIYREASFEQVQYSEQAKAVKLLMTSYAKNDSMKQYPIVEPYTYIVTGMDAFIADKETGKSMVDYYTQAGLHGFRKPVHGAGARANMAAAYHEYLRPFADPKHDGRQTAKLQIFSNCMRLIETLPVLPEDKNDREKVADCPIDHWYQAAGYGLQSRHARQSDTPAKKSAPGTWGHLVGRDDDDKDDQQSSIWSKKHAVS